MAITIHAPIQRLSQADFGDLAYSAMRLVFDIHNEFGRLFDERIYKRELASRLPGTCLEVPVDVTWLGFTKRYYLDVLVGRGGLFEFKASDGLAPRDRAQTMNYLLLTDLAHAKLINTRSEQVEHEFVNTSLRPEDRLRFAFESEQWNDSLPGAARFRSLLGDLLAEWGTCLDLNLYEEALTYFLGGEGEVIRLIPVLSGTRLLAQQRMLMAAPEMAFRITALTQDIHQYHDHLVRFVHNSALAGMFWVNITLDKVRLTCVTK